MEMGQLETFVAVAEERSFSRAAARLHRTQSAVSQSIAKLEAELGEVLFERSSRDGTLTAAGEVLRDYAVKMLNLRGEATDALGELRALHTGRLTIAANEYTCLYLLPMLSEFRTNHARLKVVVQRSLASRIPEEVLNHTVELGLLTFRPDDAQLSSTVVYRDELAFVVNPGHPLARRGKVAIQELRSCNFVAHTISSPMREKVVEAFARHKTPLQMGVELPSLEAIKRFVEMDGGVALVPGLSVRTELAGGSLVRVEVPELPLQRRLRVVHRRQASLSHAAVEFLRVIEGFASRKGEPFCFEPERAR